MGIKRSDNVRNVEIGATAGVANVSEQEREAKLRRLGHVERKIEEYVEMRTWKMEVGGHRKKGRPKRR